MGILLIIAAIILLVAYFIAARLHKHLVAVNNRFAALWSAVTFLVVCLAISFGLTYAALLNFHR